MTANVTGPPISGGLLPGDRVIRGTIARWSETTEWKDRDGLPIPDTMLVIGFTTVLRRWRNKKPEYITEHPLPDPEQLNAAIRIAEWELGLDGKPSQPWRTTFLVYLVVLQTGAVFTYIHDTYGALLAYSALEEQIAVYRLLRGEHVFPIVRLEKRPWKSAKFGMQMRPHFQILDWRAPGGLSGSFTPQSPAPQIPGPATTAASIPAPASAPAPDPAPASAPAAPPSSASMVLDHTKPVKPITLAELVADEIPWK
jgi:hypothetical protein